MKIFFLMIIGLSCYVRSTAQSKNDSALSISKTDSIEAALRQTQREDSSSKKYGNVIKRILDQNNFISYSGPSVYLINKTKADKNKDILFYMFCTILLLLGILKIFYSRYFYNIFRVFFNTSLRQNQLTDLLLQAKLPSLIFNIFFVLSTGFYTWSILNYYHLPKQANNYIILSGCIGAIGFVYIGKFLCLKFIGWVSGMTDQSDTYIFITFLINKILGVILLPFTIIILFGTITWINAAAIISLFIIGLLFLSRYFRSYSLLQNNLKLNLFHFIIYIAAIEIVPILIIYKVAINLLA